MSEIALFHSALGLRPSEHAFADRLRAAGHVVHTPDLYEGRTFDSLDDGVAHGDGLGLDEIGRRAAAVEPLGPDLVYAGFSLGACAAQIVTQTRPGAKGALLYHGALPSEELGGGWPAGVPLQIHSMEDDERFEPDVARALADEAGGELFLYPGSAHLFADPDLPDYDEAAAELLLERTLVFLK